MSTKVAARKAKKANDRKKRLATRKNSFGTVINPNFKVVKDSITGKIKPIGKMYQHPIFAIENNMDENKMDNKGIDYVLNNVRKHINMIYGTDSTGELLGRNPDIESFAIVNEFIYQSGQMYKLVYNEMEPNEPTDYAIFKLMIDDISTHLSHASDIARKIYMDVIDTPITIEDANLARINYTITENMYTQLMEFVDRIDELYRLGDTGLYNKSIEMTLQHICNTTRKRDGIEHYYLRIRVIIFMERHLDKGIKEPISIRQLLELKH